MPFRSASLLFFIDLPLVFSTFFSAIITGAATALLMGFDIGLGILVIESLGGADFIAGIFFTTADDFSLPSGNGSLFETDTADVFGFSDGTDTNSQGEREFRAAKIHGATEYLRRRLNRQAVSRT